MCSEGVGAVEVTHGVPFSPTFLLLNKPPPLHSETDFNDRSLSSQVHRVRFANDCLDESLAIIKKTWLFWQFGPTFVCDLQCLELPLSFNEGKQIESRVCQER